MEQDPASQTNSPGASESGSSQELADTGAQVERETDVAAAAAPVGPVARWALHRRLYNWVLSFAHRKHATTALFILSFVESSFFPIPPDILLGPLCLGNRKKSMWFATVTMVASVLGAFLGYAIGYGALEMAVRFIPGIERGNAETAGTIEWLAAEFQTRGQWYVFVAAVTPIPFKLLTVTAGFAKMNLLVFFMACLIGRSVRFHAVAGVFWFIGPKAVPLIDKYFNWLCVIFVILLFGGFAGFKLIGLMFPAQTGGAAG
jgi:membrane protein YqaA with SNARE-associated domain